MMQRFRRRPGDEGSALIMVLGAMTVAMLIVSGALTYALQSSSRTQQATGWYQAFAAAEAGVDDYLARLNNSDVYWQTVDCTNPALKGKTTRTNTCAWGSSTSPGWLEVPGATSAQFHYDVDVTSTTVDGTIDLVSTGRVVAAGHTTTRTIAVTLRRGGFGEFLYYTVYETKDPADYDNPGSMYNLCSKYKWAGRSSSCTDINFIGGDKINGPLHSNDSILIGSNDYYGKGPWFKGTVTTSWPQCNVAVPSTCYRSSVSNARPQFDKGITYREEVAIPDSIGNLRQHVTAGPNAPDVLGCLYTGPTRIQFLAASGNATPKMNVWSPYSTGTLNPGCRGTGSSQNGPWLVNVPQNNLILVQDVPSTRNPQPPSTGCPASSIGGFPHEEDYNQMAAEANCRYGTVYLNGTLKGRLTISAENNIIITGNVTYQGGATGTDVLGLIAENAVQIYHPIKKVCTREEKVKGKKVCVAWGPTDTELTGTITDPIINASILTLQHSFEVQQYDKGSNRGSIHIYGSIAQRFRGLVGTSGSGSTGYYKDYNYDSRLRYAPPPYFLDPVLSTWGQKTFGEITPRYRS